MTPNQQRQTATIYAFPPGGRRNLRQRDVSTSAYPHEDAAGNQRGPSIVYGSNWYHEAAVEDACGH